MLKGLAITPPVLGRISIGRIIEKNGKRLPEKDDQFTITSQVQSKDGWLAHPLEGDLLVEIKCPFRGKDSMLWQQVERGEIPVHYRWQLEHQLMVSNAHKGHLYVFDGKRPTPPRVLSGITVLPP